MNENHVAELNAALALAQGEFPSIPRSKMVKTGSYSYSYAPLDAILAACRPVLSKHGLALVQLLEATGNGGVGLRTELRHAAGGMVGSTLPFPSVPENPQQFGSLQTYFRRFAVTAILGIAPEEDDDGQQAAAGKPARPKKPAAKEADVMTSPARVLAISAILNELETLDGPPDDAESWKAYAEQAAKRRFGQAVELGTLTAAQADELIYAMNQHLERLRHQADFEQAAAVDVEDIEF